MKTKRIMFQGTGSSVGKSLLNAALCKILNDDGYVVAPFKSQNMALNSYITADGKEMGRAQVMQAECAGKAPQVEMNPVLLKPASDDGSQVIVDGRVWMTTMKARDYYSHKRELMDRVLAAYHKLASENEIIVIEGAGSPAEINLRENDIVNMGFAEAVDAPVILVCDIDKGGVFAALYGTVMLLDESERKRIVGYIINKFRGDETLLTPGIEQMRELLDIPCLGVMPYVRLDIDDEDSVTNRFDRVITDPRLTIGVVSLPHFSNASDFTVFYGYDDIEVEYYRSAKSLKDATPDLLVIPGTKNTIDDMKVLRENGMAEEILEKSKTVPVIGICGGYQMMGKRIADPSEVESAGEIEGLGLLDITTTLAPEKRTRQVSGVTRDGFPVTGYEIHMGKTVLGDAEPFLDLSGRADGAISRDGRHFGTYLHGIFDEDDFRRDLLSRLGYEGEPGYNYQEYKISQYERLAEVAREHLDIEGIYEILERSG